MIHDIKCMAKGVGGSHTRWQSKPPAHAVLWIETDEGQTTVTAYDIRGRPDDIGAVIDTGATGPGDKPFKSEVSFGDFSAELRTAIRERVVEFFGDDEFFTDPKTA